MKFRTEITITPSVSKIDQYTKIFSMGSCFAHEMATRLSRVGIATLCNPLGELYNPLSIERAVERICRREEVHEEELCQRGDVWFSYHTHGDFDGLCPQEVCQRINGALERADHWLQQAEVVILTLGTAWVYEREGEVVANCHKMPAEEFRRRRLTVEEVVASLERTIDMLAPRRVILTVSPVRHLADGLDGNSLSKAILRVAIQEIVERRGEAEYFPSYEILMDDLRDYRYYGDDMTHPSRAAVEYIWERFVECHLSREALSVAERFAKLSEAASHRPLHPESREYARFREAMLERARGLVEEFPNNEVASRLVESFSVER